MIKKIVGSNSHLRIVMIGVPPNPIYLTGRILASMEEQSSNPSVELTSKGLRFAVTSATAG